VFKLIDEKSNKNPLIMFVPEAFVLLSNKSFAKFKPSTL